MDDFFPCYISDGAGPVFSRNHGNELWVMLVEKAFAKLFGSYASLRFGWSYEAMIDLTGAPFRTIRLQDEDISEEFSNGSLWNTMLNYDQAGYLISATTPGEDIYTEDYRDADFVGTAGQGRGPSGLVSGHAYTVLTVAEVSEGGQLYKLVQLRNPWGMFEWQGDWGDNSPLWTPTLREKLGAQAIVDDGTFWMSFDDFCKYFYSSNICMIGSWVEQRRRTSFVFSNSIDQANAPHFVPPMYVLSVARAGKVRTFFFSSYASSLIVFTCPKVFLSLHQEDMRDYCAPPYVDIGLTVLRILPDFTFDLVASSGICVERQVQVEATLPAGKYLVVVVTSGCKYMQYSGEPGNKYFKNSVAPTDHSAAKVFSSEKSPSLLTQNNNLTSIACDAFREIFNRLDEDMDGVCPLKSYIERICYCSTYMHSHVGS